MWCSLKMMKKRIDEIWEDYALADGETLVRVDMYFERGEESQHKNLEWRSTPAKTGNPMLDITEVPDWEPNPLPTKKLSEF